MRNDPRILLIEADPQLIRLILAQKTEIGCAIEWVGDGRSGLERAIGSDYDLVVIDVNLPTMSGLEVCRWLHQRKPLMSILMLGSRSEDMVFGLELGADVYVTKPFSTRELVARLKALLRRSELTRDAAVSHGLLFRLHFSILEIDLVRRRVVRENGRIELTALEFDILAFLAQHPGLSVTRAELVKGVWGESDNPARFGPSLTVYIGRIRSKIEAEPAKPGFIKTIRGVGYIFAAKDSSGNH